MLAWNSSSIAQTLSTAVAFDERVFNFGTIKEKDGKVFHTFIFHNTGKGPVTISNIYSGCGCIGQALSKTTIRPGEKGKVMITFNPEYKSGFFSKEILVYSNDNKDYNHIWVEGNIVPMEHAVADDYPYDFGSGLHLRLEVMAFGYMKPAESREMVLHYANATNKEMELNFVPVKNMAGLTFTNPGKIGPKAKGVVSFSFTTPAAWNRDMLVQLYPYVNKRRLNRPLVVKILNGNQITQR